MPQNVNEQTARVTTIDGVSIETSLATPPRPRSVLLLCHGLTTDRNENGAFPRIRDRALRAGLAVARFDFRAHGASTGTNRDLRLHGLRNDADAVADFTEQQLGPSLPMVVLGVSFGSAAAIHLASTRRACRALAMWYPVLDYALNYGTGSTVPYTQLMRASATDEDPSWAEMPVVGTNYYFPKALVHEAVTGDVLSKALAELQMPVLIVHGCRDRYVSIEPARHLARVNANVNLDELPGVNHGFRFTRPWVVRRTVAWLASHA